MRSGQASVLSSQRICSSLRNGVSLNAIFLRVRGSGSWATEMCNASAYPSTAKELVARNEWYTHVQGNGVTFQTHLWRNTSRSEEVF